MSLSSLLNEFNPLSYFTSGPENGEKAVRNYYIIYFQTNEGKQKRTHCQLSNKEGPTYQKS